MANTLRGLRIRAQSRELKRWRDRRARILAAVAQGVSQVDVARRFGVSKQRIHQIVAESRRAAAGAVDA